MKKLTAILALALVALPLSTFAIDLPDYKQEARLVARDQCDQNKIIREEYEHDRYVIVVINVYEGRTFYLYFDQVVGSERFFLKRPDSKDLQELTHKEWDKTLAEDAPNAYSAIHGRVNDCVQVN